MEDSETAVKKRKRISDSEDEKKPKKKSRTTPEDDASSEDSESSVSVEEDSETVTKKRKRNSDSEEEKPKKKLRKSKGKKKTSEEEDDEIQAAEVVFEHDSYEDTPTKSRKTAKSPRTKEEKAAVTGLMTSEYLQPFHIGKVCFLKVSDIFMENSYLKKNLTLLVTN